jgi:hypothetical protein
VQCEAALHSPSQYSSEIRRQNIKKRSGINRAKNETREQKRKGGTKSLRLQMASPIKDLLFRIVQLEECSYLSSVPSYERPDDASKCQNAFRAATLNGVAAEARLHVGDLNGIYVNRHDLVTGREFHGGTAGRGNAEDASFRLERTKLNFSVLVHATEKQLAFPRARCAETATLPGRHGDG